MNRLPTLLASFSFALGAASAIAALTLWNQQQKFIDGAQRVPATVADIREIGGKRMPVLEFTQPDGTIQHVSAPNVSADAYPAKAKVELLYDPVRPMQSRVADFRSQWLTASIFGACALVFLAIAGRLFRTRARAAARPSAKLQNGAASRRKR